MNDDLIEQMVGVDDLMGWDKCPHCRKKIQFLCKVSLGTISVFKEEYDEVQNK